MDKRFAAIIGTILVIFVGILFLSNRQSDNGSGAKTSGVQPTSHIRGNTASSVKLVEYGDFECPACGSYYPIVEQVYAKYQDKISFQFRNLPLNQIHRNAFAAARAAEAASNQGKFWEMYNLLYQNQRSWAEAANATTTFNDYALQLNLNMDTFKKDFASSTVNERINADKAAFNKTGLGQSTPTFFLNGKKIQPVSLEEFSKLIDDALKQQTS